MSNNVRNVTKQLLGAEDVAFGRGTIEQTRGGATVPIHKLDLDLPVADEAELAVTNPNVYPKASIGSRLFVAVNGQFQELSHIVPVIYRVGGMLSADYPYCENGNVIAKWTGAFPKTLTTEDADFAPAGWQIYTVGSGRTIISETQPPISYGAQGLRWYNPTIPATFVYYVDGDSGQWVEEASQAVDGGLRSDLGVEASYVGKVVNGLGLVDKYNAVGDGVADDATAFAACHAANGYILLAPNKRYFVTSLPDLATLKIIGDNSVIVYDRLLADRSFTLLSIQGVTFDAQNSNLTRCIRVRKNSKLYMRKVNGLNINSATFVRMFDISTENVEIDIEDMYCESLVSAEDGTVGNNNGATRFIYVGDEDATPLVAPSRGRIVNIRGKNLMPREDGDMIHVQSSDAAVLDIIIHDVYGENIAKRVVKVQANGVEVSKVHCDARSNVANMYAIVSHYGLYGSVRDVSGIGKFDNGVDTQYESTQASDINVTNTGTATSQGAALKCSGGLFGRNVTGYGFEHIVANYISLVSNANTDIQGVFGTCTGVAAFVRAALVSGRVEIEDIKATQGSTSRLCQVTRTSSNTFTIVDLKDIIGNSGLFTAVDITGASISKVKNVDINQTVSGNPVTVNGGEAYLEDITGRGATTDPVFLNATTKAVVTRSRGGTSSQVLTTGCNNTIVNNAICAAGVPASRNTSTASTNTQNIGTLTFV